MTSVLTLEDVDKLVAVDDAGKYDATVYTKRLEMDPTLGSFVFDMDPKRNTRRFTEQGLEHLTGNYYGATDTGYGQLCRMVGLPDPRWVRRNPTELQAQLFNYWIQQQPRSALFRFRGNTIRAALTDQYVPINNNQLMRAAHLAIPDTIRGELKQYALDDHRFFMKILVPGLTRDITRADGRREEMKVGVMITNSEVGWSSVMVEPFIYRKACTNDLVVEQERAWRQQHRWVAPARLNGLVEMQVARAFKDGADAIEDFERLDTMRVREPERVLREILKSGKFADKYGDLAVQHLRAEPGDTRFAVVNAITSMGKTQPDDTRIEIERFAGRMMRTGRWAGDN